MFAFSGVFSLCQIPRGTEFGPFEGRIVEMRDDETVDQRYSWEVRAMTGLDSCVCHAHR